MKRIIVSIEQTSKWYGIAIIFLYSLLLAEFYSTINRILPFNDLVDHNIFIIFSRINYVITVLSGIIIWIITTFLFHLTALLFDGHSTFKQLLFISSYPYIVPVMMILVGIFLLDGIQIPDTEDITHILLNNSSFQLAMNLINYSFILYYLIVAVFIQHIYRIKYIYAALSVVIPVVSIWLISELFKWI